jgi:hypothetical protein
VSTDPFVAPTLVDTPRQEQNLAPGVHYPPARPWRADRPGDVHGQPPSDSLLGVPGPDIGYALLLVERVRDRLALAPHEHRADAEAVVGELAMRRASSYGRAPVMADVECSMLVLGYQGGVAPDFAKWRVLIVSGAHEDYWRRRAICGAVDRDALRLVPAALAPRVTDARRQLFDAVSALLPVPPVPPAGARRT